jgi:hypothetical protein
MVKKSEKTLKDKLLKTIYVPKYYNINNIAPGEKAPAINSVLD